VLGVTVVEVVVLEEMGDELVLLPLLVGLVVVLLPNGVLIVPPVVGLDGELVLPPVGVEIPVVGEEAPVAGDEAPVVGDEAPVLGKPTVTVERDVVVQSDEVAGPVEVGLPAPGVETGLTPVLVPPVGPEVVGVEIVGVEIVGVEIVGVEIEGIEIEGIEIVGVEAVGVDIVFPRVGVLVVLPGVGRPPFPPPGPPLVR
jgi:hypothetical protein